MKIPKLPKQFAKHKPGPKIPTRKAKTPLEQVADELGEAYEAAKEKESVAKAQMSRANERIKAVALSEGTVEGKDTVLTGKTFRIGFKTCDGSPSVDLEAFKKLFRKRGTILNAVLKSVVVESADEKAVEKLVQDGKITSAELKQFVTPGKSFERLVCEKLSAKGKGRP